VHARQHFGAVVRRKAPARRGAGPHLFASASAVDVALKELTAEAKSAAPEMADLLRIIRDRLDVQDTAASTIERGLKRVYASIMAAIEELLAQVPGASVADRARRLNLNAQAIARIIDAALAESPGLGPDGRPRLSLLEEVAEAQAELAEMTARSMAAAGAPAQVSVTAIRAATSDFQRRFFDSQIIGPTTDRLLDGLQSSLAGESLDAAVLRIAEANASSIPQAVTEARTTFAEFDRTVSAQTAAEAGFRLFLYDGPVDRLARPFCSELVGHVFTDAQIGQLNNAQTAVSPLYSCGGYNCRHNWSPLSAALAESLGAPMGTDAMVKAANRAAKESR
jgi:hypothetical protein